MAIATRLTERLGVTHPVMLAPMDLVADGKLYCFTRFNGTYVLATGETAHIICDGQGRAKSLPEKYRRYFPSLNREAAGTQP